MITIAVDAMGGDHAPRPEVEGSVLAAREFNVRILLVGPPNVVRGELAKHATEPSLPIEIVPASEVITMNDHPAQAFRRKKDSSVHVSARLVREAKAHGLVSAGNTGAVMTVARFLLGTLESVDRVALAAPFPNAKGGVSVLLDVGANVDSKAEHLEQFAVMGEIYYRVTFGNKRPRVGLLSVGEEEIKGNELTRQVYTRLKNSHVQFVGNVEGGDLFSGAVEVIVCDGFVGNIALKICEGLAVQIFDVLRKSLKSSPISQFGALLSQGAFKGLKKKIDYTEYGGAPLLGVRGVCVIGHGKSNANAVKNAIRVAAGLARSGMNEKIEEELSVVAAGEGSVAGDQRPATRGGEWPYADGAHGKRVASGETRTERASSRVGRELREKR